MANRYLSEDGIAGAAEKSSVPETLYVDLQGDQRTRPIMCATEFSSAGIHKKKSTSFQITSVTVQGSRLSNDGGEDSADDLDESHTEDISSDILDCSKTTDLDNDPLSSDNSNANLDDLGVSVASKQFIPVKVLTNDPDSFGASHSIGVSPGLSVDNTVIDTDLTLVTSTNTALPVITTQVPIVNSLPEHLQHRFKVVKIVSTEPFKRGRWVCMDFTDPPAIHGEPRVDSTETTDTTHISSSFNVAPSENPPSVAQFYEFPVNQTSISNIPQPQQAPQSVYGLLLPVANSSGLPVTKVQNVGVQATPNVPVEAVKQQAVAIQVQPIATQSQATQATVPATNVPVPQSQLVQVAPSSAQNQTILPTTQTQGIYPTSSQVSQPNQVISATQPTQHQQALSASQQVLPPNHQAQTTTRNQTAQALPVIQSAPVLTQPSQVLPGSQQSSTLPVTQQPHVQSAMQPNPILTSSLAGQGMAVPPQHVMAGSQTAQGMTVGQPNQGLPISQANPGLPASQSLNMPVAQPVLSNVQQLIPISQPSQILPMSQPVVGLPIQTTMLTSTQPPQDLTASQPNQGIPVSQPNQGLPNLKQAPSLPIQSGHGMAVNQTPQVMPTTQATQGLPVTNPPLTGNLSIGLTVTQSNTSLPAAQTGVQPVLAADSHPTSGANTLAPTGIVTQSTGIITQPAGIVTQPAGIVTQPAGIVTQPAGIITQPAGIVTQPAGIVAQPVNSDTMTSSQPASKTSPPVQGSVKDTQMSATSTSNQSPLLDILPDALGTKTVQDGEESESASSGTNTVAIDNKIEQAMDLVKSHLMFAVREEVDVLKEKITELMDRISQLEHENGILKANATPEMLNQLNSDQGGGGGGGGGGAPPSNSQQPPAASHEHS